MGIKAVRSGKFRLLIQRAALRVDEVHRPRSAAQAALCRHSARVASRKAAHAREGPPPSAVWDVYRESREFLEKRPNTQRCGQSRIGPALAFLGDRPVRAITADDIGDRILHEREARKALAPLRQNASCLFREVLVNPCSLLEVWCRSRALRPDARQCLTPSPARSILVAALCVVGLAGGAGAHAQATPPEREALAPSWLPRLQQSAPPVAGERGQWVAWATNYTQRTAARDVGLSDADVRAWDANLRRLLEALQAAPVLRDLNGFSAGGRASLDGEWQGAGARPRKAPAVGDLWIGTWRPEVAARDAAAKRAVDSDTRRLLINLNRIPEGPRAPWMQDAQGEFFVLPKVASPWPGTTIVRESLLVVRADKPTPYLPVSQGRVLQAFAARFADGEAQAAQVLAMRRQALADYLSPANEARRRAEIETETRRFMNANRMDEASARRRAEAIDQAHVEKLRAEANPAADDPVFAPALAARAARERLASMSPAERDAPAWMSAAPDKVENPFALPLRAPNEPGAAPVMQVNPAFFDPALPRTALQALVVRDLKGIAEHAHLDSGRARFGPARVNLLVLQQTDWPALARQVLR